MDDQKTNETPKHLRSLSELIELLKNHPDVAHLQYILTDDVAKMERDVVIVHDFSKSRSDENNK